jgi:sRNA-binding regulator protein Hfq
MATDAKVHFLDKPQTTIQAIGLPDEHYNIIKKAIKKNKTYTARDKNGTVTIFFFEGEQMKARTKTGTQEVFSLSQLKNDKRSPLSAREEMIALVKEKNPGIFGDELEAAVDILLEGIESTKKLVSMGVEFSKAKQIVGAALANDNFSSDDVLNILNKIETTDKE